ncbi:sodium-dependent dopamine transporter-like [Littorina saxatilis]|uniref:sodium-dependent dopamine transporter-like n=1 Tax=Littorina saxatilis TaxID=31220 RepID=UPI0038B45D0E
MTLSRQKPKSSSLKSAPASNDKYWTPQLIRRSPTSDSLRSMKTPNSDSFMSIKSPRKAPVSPQLKPQLSRSESLSSIKTTKEALGWTLNRQLTKSEGELSVTALGDTPWTSSVVFIGMEVRLMADLAHLLSWDIACAAPRPKEAERDGLGNAADETSSVIENRNDDKEVAHSPKPATPQSADLPHRFVNMDDTSPLNDNSNNLGNAFTSSSSTTTNPHTSYNFTGPKSSSIELDNFRQSSAMSGGDEVRFAGTREDANGRVAEVGIVLPIVPFTQDPVMNGGDGEGGGGGGDKPHTNDTGHLDEKTPLQAEDQVDDGENWGHLDEKTPLQAEDQVDDRENWGNKMDFLLSVIGYAVDLANVWRFPYLCYKNGGGAFLVPYFSVLLLGAMPVFFMELSMGQFHRQGPLCVWKMAPMFKGIGMASCFMAYVVAFYYNVVIGWSFLYLFSSFSSAPLPWTSCSNEWNSDRCWEGGWTDANNTPANRTYNKNTSLTSTLEFFERGVLSVHKSKGLDDLGQVRWQLVLCTLLTFCMLYFCLWKGVKTTGKVVYVTATMPYIILTILLVRGVTLPGAGDGIKFFITPHLDKLADPGVWIDAAIQIFFSVGAGFGTHIAYASYNKFHNNCQKDVIITVIVNSFTSIFSGFVIFSYLGYMSKRSDKDISVVATEGPGLVFNVYPEAIATLPGSNGWSIIFFFMLLTLGIDSAFGGLESILTGLHDELKGRFRFRYLREVLTLVVVSSAFLCSLPCLTEGGIYVFTILDTFAAGTSILFTVLCQVIAVSWFYGIDQFCKDVEKMTGSQPSMYWRICWKFICPILLLIIVISSIISYVPMAYTTADMTYVYPFYANVLGWCIACSSMLLIPGFAIYKIISTPGPLKERIALCISPVWEHEEIRQKKYIKRYHKEHWLSL